MGSVKLLKASAGSGKTFMLAYEYVKAVIDDPARYRHILAVTFTNKATEEMKRRIVSEINDLATGKRTRYLTMLTQDLSFSEDKVRSRAAVARTKILHDYSHFAVLTIDKFFQRIIRSFIKELGIDLNFNLELQTDTLLSSAADALIDDISTDGELKRWIAAFVEEKIAENKKWDIKTGLTNLGGEVFREGYKRSAAAAASKGQLEKIVAEANAKAYPIVNAMRAAAAEALEVIASHGLTVNDFAYGRMGFVSYFIKTAEGDISEYGTRVQKALDSDENWYSKKSSAKDEIIALIPRLRPLLEKVCGLYSANARFLNSVELLRENYRNFAMLTDLSRKIETICASDSVMPISETNVILNKLISGNDTPFIFEKAGNHFTRFMIDEFQDTSAMQWENFVPLLHNALSQAEDSPVLLVGDVKQSIYRWRGGDWRILANEIEREFAHVISEDLTTNYRSQSTVIAFNNSIISGCVAIDNDRLNNELDAAVESGAISKATRGKLYGMLASAYLNHEQHAANDDAKGYVNVTSYGRNEDEAAVPPVIRRVEELQERGYAPGDIAILVRYNAEGIKIANMLLEYKSRNPGSGYCYDVVTQEALTIGNAPVSGFIMACLKLAVSPGDPLGRAVYNKWLGMPADTPLTDEDAGYFKNLGMKPAEEAFESLSIRYALNAERENIAYLQALHEQVISFGGSSVSDIPLFIKWWDEKGAGQSVNVPQSGSAITIITIHKAKGLQYRAVIIPYCDWQLAPSSRTIVWSGNDSEELGCDIGAVPIGFKEKMGRSSFADSYFNELVLSHVDNINTFYVAATRAMEELHIMMPDNAGKRPGRISSLINESIKISGGDAVLGGLKGKVKTGEGDKTVVFGAPAADNRAGGGERAGTIYPDFRSYETGGRLKLKYRNQRYLDDDAGNSVISPRDYGILMHRVFENALGKADISDILLNMRRDGSLSEEETRKLEETIDTAFGNSLINSWFDEGWDMVRNESEIIIPGDASVKRPDRVMVKDRKAVVVDYKFGLNRPAAHARQIRQYMELLAGMGYKDVEGYIWYVSLDDIEPVSL